MELRSLLPEIGLIPVLGFIDGLAGLDITRTHVEGVTERVYAASQGKPYQKVTQGKPYQKVTWVNLEG
jgi:hypothetical protein